MHKIAIIEDQRPTLEALTGAFESSPHYGVVASALTAGDVHSIAKLMPDVCLVDIMLNGRDDGVYCIETLSAALPSAKIIVITGFPDTDLLFDCYRRGACGFVQKSDALLSIVDTVDRIVAGDVTVSPSIAMRLDSHFDSITGKIIESFGLTDRQAQILELLSHGCTNENIATQRQLGVETVRSELKEIFRKMHAANRTHAVGMYLRTTLCRGDEKNEKV